MISMPLSSGSFWSSSARPARPPPNSVLKVCWKLWLMAANASTKRWRVVSSMRLIASLVCAIDSTRSFRVVILSFFGDDDAGVGRGMTFALELIDFGDHLVEGRVHRILTGVREVRQICFGRRARDVELGHDRADCIEGAARFLDGHFMV